MNFNTKKGFTLIELLVVISIIGLLSTVVLASLNTARSKGRDAKRMSDIRQIRIAIELYRNTTGYYPTDLSTDLVPTYIKSIPADPSGGTGPSCRPSYCYSYNPSPNPTSYQLGAQMENLGSVLNSDADFNSSGSWAFGGFDGTVPNIYDLKN